jgi:hypothetical protein
VRSITGRAGTKLFVANWRLESQLAGMPGQQWRGSLGGGPSVLRDENVATHNIEGTQRLLSSRPLLSLLCCGTAPPRLTFRVLCLLHATRAVQHVLRTRWLREWQTWTKDSIRRRRRRGACLSCRRRRQKRGAGLGTRTQSTLELAFLKSREGSLASVRAWRKWGTT